MKSEARISKNSQLCGRRFRYSDFVIPSDFVIRHSDLRIAFCSTKRSVSGLARAAGGGSVHGQENAVLCPGGSSLTMRVVGPDCAERIVARKWNGRLITCRKPGNIPVAGRSGAGEIAECHSLPVARVKTQEH